MEKLARSRRKTEKLKPIARKRRNYIFLLLTILFGTLTFYLFYNLFPTYKFTVSNIQIPILPVFLFSLTGFIFSITTFLAKSRLQGIIFSVFITGYLIMRTQGLTHWIFLIIVIALFVTTELFIFKKK